MNTILVKQLTEEISTFIKRINAHYGEQKWERWREPVGELVRTILSQNTTDKNSLGAYAKLIEKYPTWEDLILAEEEEIADIIRSGGLANIKAKKIKKALIDIKQQRGEIDLEFLAEYDVDKAEEYLKAIDGVGPKTAACVLIFSFNFPIMPVDTHIHRVSNRLGLVSTKSREKTHELMKTLIPTEEMYNFHLNIITHGRRVCKASKPQCQDCFIKDICKYYKEQDKNGS